MKKLNKKGQAFIWEVYLLCALVGFGAYQVKEGKWGKNGTEANPSLGDPLLRSEKSGSLIKI